MMKILFFLLFSLFYINKKMNYGFVYMYFLLMFMLMGEMFTGSVNKILNKMMMLDSLSLLLLVLSAWISILMILSSSVIFNKGNTGDKFVFVVTILLLSLLLSFMSMNLLMFYFFFEFSLIPTLVLIMGWGYQPERIQAGVYFLFYTLTASLPLLLMLILVNMKLFTLNYLFFMNLSSTGLMSYFILFSLLMAFLVKMPLFMFHLWLPKAHVEAPVSGSMILAGVLLKLGGFGLCRVFKLISLNLMKINSYLIGLSLFSMIYVGLICCRMSDLKALVAYSSVAHMGLVVCGIFSYYMIGFTGCLLMLVAHGISSSGLFCMVNLYYERSHSRSIFLNKGLMLTSSVFTLMFFMLCISNVSAPPTINLLSEIILMSSIMSVDFFMVFIFPLGSFLGMIFTMFMFSYTQHGKLYGLSFSSVSPNMNEYNVLLLHIAPLNFLILKSEIFVY